MEILTLLRLDGKRLAALTMLGILTGGIAAAAVGTRPATYEASTTVFVGQALPSGASAFDVGPIVADFEKVITLPQVREAAAAPLGLDPLGIVATTSRNGSQGATVEVTTSGSTADSAEALSRGLSVEAMRFLAQREVDRATAFENERRVAVDQAQATVQKLLAQNGFASPVRTYEETMTRYVQLTLDKSDPTRAITNEQRVAADAESTRLRLQLPNLQQLAAEFEKAQQDLTDARAALQTARTMRAAAEDVLATATTDVALSQGETVRTSQVAALAQAFIAAVAATLVAGTAFFLLADSRRQRAVARPAPRTDGDASTAGKAATANGASTKGTTPNGAGIVTAPSAPIDLREDPAPATAAASSRAAGLVGTESVFTRPSKDAAPSSPVGTDSGPAASPRGAAGTSGPKPPSGRRRLGQ